MNSNSSNSKFIMGQLYKWTNANEAPYMYGKGINYYACIIVMR